MKVQSYRRILEQPDEDLWLYNCRDGETTHRAAVALDSDLTLFKTRRVHDLMLALAPAVYRMQERGLMTDPERRAALAEAVKGHLAQRSSAVLDRFSEACAGELAAAVAFGGWLRRFLNPRRKATLKSKDFNPNSKQHLTLLLSQLGMRWHQTTPSGLARLDLDVVMKLRREYSQHEALLTALWEYAKLEKVRADWLDDSENHHLLCRDQRCRASVRVTGTASGRLAESVREWCVRCQETNHGRNRQNIPKSDDPFCHQHAPIGSIFIAPPGRILLERDYSAQEAWIAARISDDRVFLDKLADPVGVHIRNAMDLFAVKAAAAVTPQQKRLAKIFLYGGVLYEGGPETIRSSFEEEGIIVPLADIKLWQARWKIAHHRYVRWCYDLIADACRQRPMHVTTPLGRRRNFIGESRGWRREAIAHVISGTGADHTNLAMIDLDAKGWEIVLHRHDSLVIEVDEKDLSRALAESKAAFEADRGFGSLRSEAKAGPSMFELRACQG